MSDASRPAERISGLDGLRGIAVLLVVVYHFAPDLLPGGFIGVDVFFVLSGFLISSLLLKEVDENATLSLRGFWNRRFRRLLPAAVLAVVTVVALSRWYLTEYSRSSLRTHALSTLAYVANWWEIASSNSYEQEFGTPSPLQHFWSLAIEEQFYVFFPLLCIALLAMSRRRNRANPSVTVGWHFATSLLVVSSVGAVLSATTMVWMHRSGVYTSRIYYGTETRVQAILIGVVFACLHFRRQRASGNDATRQERPSTRSVRFVWPWCALIAILAVAFHIRFETAQLYLGGLTGLALVCGLLVSLVVKAPTHAVSRLLSISTLRYVGGISYALYLWHWPVRVFITEAEIGAGGITLFGLRLVLSLTLAVVSTNTIEKWFRTPTRTRASRREEPWKWLPTTAAAMGVVLLCTVGSVEARRSPSLPTDLLEIAEDTRPYRANDQPQRPLRLLYLGDSVLWTLGGGKFFRPQPVDYVSPFDPGEVALWNKSIYSCSLIGTDFVSTGVRRKQPEGECSVAEGWVDAVQVFHPDVVVVSSFFRDGYPHYVADRLLTPKDREVATIIESRLNGLEQEFSRLGARTVLLIQESPGGCPSVSQRVGCENFEALRSVWLNIAKENEKIGVIDLPQLICGDSICPRDESSPLFREDGVHYGPTAAPILAERLQETFLRLYDNIKID